MLIAQRAQKPLPLGGVTGDDVHIWDADLKVIDELLRDEQLVDILWQSFRRGSPASPARGRRRMALNRVLRTGVLKHLKTWSWRELFKELQRNLDYRAFSQLFEEAVPSAGALCRNLAHVDAQAVREVNERVTELGREAGVIRGRMYRQDTTVCETNIHHPTDSSLLQDGVRVLQRVVGRVEQLVPSVAKARDRSRAVRNRVLEIGRAARSRGQAAQQRRVESYRALLRIVRPVITGASTAARKLGDRRVTRHLSWVDELIGSKLKRELDTMLPRVEQVVRQTRARVCRGINNYPDKLLSLFEPKTCIIRKGKAHKPTEFGRLVDIVEVENGFVSDYQVLDGNPSDGTLLLPALDRHRQRFGRAPYLAATDRGFWTKQNEREAYALGVKRVAIPATGRVSAARLRLQRSRWFRQAQRWRANGEGRIGTLKNVYGMDRCLYKGDEAMERWVGWCVLANNLVVVARALRRRQDDERTRDTEERDARAVA
jgi:IS5 family transposase